MPPVLPGGFRAPKGHWPTATSQPRMPGARALRPGSSASFLPTALGGPGARASRGARLQRRAGGSRPPRAVRRPSGPGLADPPRSPRPEGPGWKGRIRPRPPPGDGAAGPALQGGAQQSSGQCRGRQGGRGRPAAGRTFPARDSPPFTPAARGPLRPPVAAPAPRARS